VYPSVVGPRYSTTPAAGASDTEKWVENPYLHSGEEAPYKFGLNLDIETGIPIAQLGSPSHDIEVEYTGKGKAHVDIKKNGKAGTRDFVLRYRLAGGRIQTGALLYPSRDENFFLLMMEPPARVENEAIVPREYIFIVDVSGSMNGFPINVAKNLMEDIIHGLRPNDLMNVLLFAGGSAVMSEGRSLTATAPNKKRAISWIKSQHGRGGTNILPALKRALGLPRTKGISRIVVVITDGYVSVEPQTFELIRKELGQANLFAFGIGSSVNRHIIEGMARVGRGEPFVVLNREEARKKASQFRRYIRSPVLTDIRVSFEGMSVHDVEPLAVPDLFALRPVVVFGKYEGKPRGQVVIEGKTASVDLRKVLSISPKSASADNSALRLLWARHRIMRLSDLNLLRKDDRRVDEVTELGLKYSVMTQYTSFVAVDKIRRADGEIVTVKQPLPLPDGVSDLAVGRPSAAAGKAMRSMSLPNSEDLTGGGLGEEEEGDDYPTAPAEVTVDMEPKEIIKRGGTWISVEEVRGEMDRGALRRALRSQLQKLRPCCPKPSGPGAWTSWEFVYRLVIASDGTVGQIKLVMASIKDGSAIDCLEKALRGLRFPPTPRGSELTLKVICRPTP
jgi:Ca-activated chloride channel family protein